LLEIGYALTMTHLNTSDQLLRTAVLEWLADQVQKFGDVLPASMLQAGFEFRGRQVPIISQQGIFRPQGFEVPISIRTGVNSPYNDAETNEGLLRYDYESGGVNRQSNAGLRQAMTQKIPLVYLKIVQHRSPRQYLVLSPVYIIHDNPNSQSFLVNLEYAMGMHPGLVGSVREDHVSESYHDIYDPKKQVKRQYALRTYKQRLHQSTFRENVLHAYRNQCTICSLGHRQLLDAAHITPDSEADGFAITSNGLSLCKIHHAAFDSNVLGISPDYQVHVRDDILEEVDGPMLRHGIQEMHGKEILLPRGREQKPDKDRLALRYEKFLAAG